MRVTIAVTIGIVRVAGMAGMIALGGLGGRGLAEQTRRGPISGPVCRSSWRKRGRPPFAICATTSASCCQRHGRRRSKGRCPRRSRGRAPDLSLSISPRNRIRCARFAWEGSPVTAELRDEHLIVPLPDGGGPVTVEIDFMAGDGSLNRQDDFLYTLFVPDRARVAHAPLRPAEPEGALRAAARRASPAGGQWPTVHSLPARTGGSGRC